MSERPPGPRGFGAYVDYLRAVKTPHLLFQDVARRYGDFARLPAGPKQVFLLSHPDHVREVFVDNVDGVSKGRGAAASGRMLGDGLLTTEATVHDPDRAVVEPALDPERLIQLADAIAAEGDRCLSRWKVNGRVDVYPALAKVTLPMAVQGLMGEGSDGTLGPRIVQSIEDLYDTFNAFKVLPSVDSLAKTLPLPKVRRFERASRRVDDVMTEAIERRGADPGPWVMSDWFPREGRPGLSDRQIRDHLVQLFGGHRPARVTQSWTMHLLARNPEIQEKLYAEIDSVVGDRLPGGSDYHRLEYTRKVFAEGLRWYPPVWVLTRRVNRDLAVRGGTLPAGSIIFVSEWVIHHDPRWYEEPERFDPERFSEEATEARPEFAYFPFGAGYRDCVGSPFAWLEGVLLLALIVQRWRISSVPGFEPEPLMRVNIKPRNGMVLALEPRR
jgi:cytochrome P450